MKRKEPIRHRIFMPFNGTLVNINTLSQRERDRIGHTVFIRLADSLMWSQGYVRMKNNEEIEKASDKKEQNKKRPTGVI